MLGGPDAVPPLPNWTPLPTDRPVFAVGRDAGQGPVVEIRDAATGQVIDRFNAYDPSFAGGVRVATADVNGDGFFDIVTAAGGGGGPVVNVFSGTDGALLSHFFAFDPGFRNGFSVAAGDLDGDAKAEIVVGAGNGGGPAVAVFHGGDLTEVQSFFAFDPAFRGGVTVAVGNFAGQRTEAPSSDFFPNGSLSPKFLLTVFSTLTSPGVRSEGGGSKLMPGVPGGPCFPCGPCCPCCPWGPVGPVAFQFSAVIGPERPCGQLDVLLVSIT